MSRRKRVWLIVGAVAGAVVVVFGGLCAIFIDNKKVEYEYFTVRAQEVGGGFKIVHLSDLHFPSIRVDLNKMIQKIGAEAPDFIAVTGDVVDTKSNVETCGVFGFMEKLVTIAPVFFVNGNHDERNAYSASLYTGLQDRGVVLLKDAAESLEIRGAIVRVAGLWYDNGLRFNAAVVGDCDVYSVLLAHDPDVIWAAREQVNADLVLCGHTHGGQVRIFGKGVFSANGGLFPRLTGGEYDLKNAQGTRMIVSRGVGTGTVPVRFANLPHVPVIQVV